MRRRDSRTDERAIAALFAGPRAPEDENLARFVAELRQAASPVKPDDELRHLFSHGLDVTDAPSTARPAPMRSRGRRVIETLVGKLAGLGLAAKIGLASAVAVAGVTGAGVSDNLPDQAQDAFNNVVGTEVEIEDVELPEEAEIADEAEFGQEVSEKARTGELDGREVAEEASEEGRQTAEDASEGRSENGDENSADGLGTAGENTEDVESQVHTPAGPETGDEASEDAPAGPETGADRSEGAGGQADNHRPEQS